MSLYLLHDDYRQFLENDQEFIRNSARCYVVLTNLSYKMQKISVAIPLRANINKNFQQYKDEYIACAPTEHTRSECVAGWHTKKLVPVTGAVLVKYQYDKTKRLDLYISEQIAKLKKMELKQQAQNLLSKIELSTDVFGAINIDNALSFITPLTLRIKTFFENTLNKTSAHPHEKPTSPILSKEVQEEVAATTATKSSFCINQNSTH